jgi:transcriptional regulator with XRE-family HTH domain
MKTTQRQIAKRIGISESYLSRLLAGAVPMTWHVSDKIAGLTNTDIATVKSLKPRDLHKLITSIPCPVPGDHGRDSITPAVVNTGGADNGSDR